MLVAVGQIILVLLGGGLSIAGGWFALKQQARQREQCLGRALYLELTAPWDEAGRTQADDFFKELLSNWANEGKVENADFFASLFDRPPAEAYPVYYSAVGDIGHLPEAVVEPLVKFHAIMRDLAHSTRTLILHDKVFPNGQIGPIAFSLANRVAAMSKARNQAIEALQQYAEKSPPIGKATPLPKDNPDNP